MSKSVFISHSSKDKEIANAIVNLLEHGIGLPEDEIFCSSVEGYGVPSGKDFLSFIKDQIEEPKIVILLLTPSYWESKFCLCEMGAAWVKSHQIFPILVPPLNNKDLQAVLLTTQAFEIKNSAKYNEIRDCLLGFQELKLDKKSNKKWDIQRQEFIDKLPGLLDQLIIPKEVSVEEYSDLQSQLEESQVELNKYQQDNQTLHNYIERLKSLKNIDEVNTIKQELKITGTSEQFEAQVEQIKQQLREITSEKEVSICILSDYYKQTYREYHKTRRTGFKDAERNSYIQIIDDSGKVEGIKVFWNTKEMILLKQQLTELDKFLEEVKNIEELQSYTLEHYGVEVEPEIPRFWTRVYDL
jgi:hypothetical protein